MKDISYSPAVGCLQYLVCTRVDMTHAVTGEQVYTKCMENSLECSVENNEISQKNTWSTISVFEGTSESGVNSFLGC